MKTKRPLPPRIHRKWQSILKPHTELIASLRPFNTYQEIADILRERTDGSISVTRSTVYKFCKIRNLTHGYGSPRKTPTLSSSNQSASASSASGIDAIELAKKRISARVAEAKKQNKTGDKLTILTETELAACTSNQH